ncbi:MAG: SDR family oxidoreductase [Candidatus Marinimicrobia bacterium]|nr:SDR family oxidoreductase [Candidatus Neomarinimicrobiota bacterium]MCF7839889.1 SDR family oxidoreductase [Candidatus Neomarinimicrobiota bacterium]
MDFGIVNKIVWVQGASKGLGFACALELAREGAAVAISSRSEENIMRAADRIRATTGGRVLPLVCDVTDMTARDETREKILAQWGTIDILVANSGGPVSGKFDEFTREDWKSAMDNNLFAMLESAQEVLDGMLKKRWGRIVFITSVSVKQPLGNLILSNTARAGLTGFAKTLSTQVAAEGITVNCVLPGIHETERLREIHGDDFTPEFIAKDIPMKRLGQPEELAAAVVFLASDRAGYITGQSVVVDGGFVKSLF